MKLTIITGRSGSGKSVCLHALEDLGFYCIDNIPVSLLPALIDHIPHHQPIAVGIDARNLPTELGQFSVIINTLKKSASYCEIIFLDAEDHTLINRFSDTRRKHPLTSEEISLKEALEKETLLLDELNRLADLHIDTTHLSIAQLRELARTRISHKTQPDISLLFQSFGYKAGVPLDADYVFDVRCLPNPYWEVELRQFTGLEPKIVEYLKKQPQTQQLFDDIRHFLETWLPRFMNDNRNYMTIAIGCTGGQHRSVYIAEQLANYFQTNYKNVQVRHREL